MKRRAFFTAAAACLLAVSISGCGSTNGNDNAGDSARSEPETNEATPASTAFGQKSVWMQYGDDQISKDTSVERILVFDGKGNVTVYDTRGIVLNGGTSYEVVRFGDLDGLSDDEIIDLAKEKDRERFDATKQSAIDETNEDIESFAGMPDYIKNAEEGQKVNETAEYQEPKAVPFTLKLETDDTGNSAASETLSFEHQSLNSSHFYSGSHIGSHPDRYADEALYETEQVDIKLFSPTYSTTSIVYDTTFGGFQGLTTVVDDVTTSFTWDAIDTKGIEVD